MDEAKPPLNFEPTNEQVSFFDGTEYGKPENRQRLKETIIARILTGDESAGNITPEQKKSADQVMAAFNGQQARGEVDRPFFGFSDAFSGIWDAVKGLGVTAPAAFYQLTEGLERPDKYSDSAKAAFAEADAYTQAMQAKNAETGATDVGSAFRDAGGSLGFSLGSMGAQLVPKIAGTIAGAKAGATTGAIAA